MTQAYLPTLETITLGGGCFWCIEAVYKEVKGVLDVQSGYCNGHLAHPSYEAVCTGQTGHAEVVKLVYDAQVIGVREILEIFFAVHDGTQLNRQGHDVGTQYRSGIYFSTPAQQSVAQSLIDEINRAMVFEGAIVTELAPLANYWPAEEMHQDFFERNPNQGYCLAVAAPKVAKFRQTFLQWAK